MKKVEEIKSWKTCLRCGRRIRTTRFIRYCDSCHKSWNSVGRIASRMAVEYPEKYMTTVAGFVGISYGEGKNGI